MKKCLNCGTPFEPAKPKAVYCSQTCRTAAFRKKHKKEGAKRGRPKKKNNLIATVLPGPILIPIIEPKEVCLINQKIEIKIAPPGLKGIDLAIWKAEQKTKIK
jgi:hypothetical protein